MVYVKMVNKRKFAFFIEALLNASENQSSKSVKDISMSKVWLHICYFSLNRPLAALFSASTGN